MKNTTAKIPQSLLEELEKAFQSISFGSIEIYVQDKVVTQISVRNITKTSVGISKTSSKDERPNGGISTKKSFPSTFEKSNVQIKLRP